MNRTLETVEVDLIAPSHLAGGGDPAWVTVPLHRGCGWSHGNDPLMPRVILSSPDQKAVLRLEPDPDGQWWTLHHAPEAGRRPAWYATFTASTPVEFIAAVMDTLTDPAAVSAPSDPCASLRRAGWAPAAAGSDGLVSPDGTARAERLGSAPEPGAWFVTATLEPYDQPLWQARFGEHTPPHLIAAFTAHLAKPDPVLRLGSRSRLPRDPNVVTRHRRDVNAVVIAAALETRVQSLASRQTTSPASGKPEPPPASRPHRR